MSEAWSVAGRTALITGASGGLGARFAYVLAEAGTHVIIAARRKPELDDARLRYGIRKESKLRRIPMRRLGKLDDLTEPLHLRASDASRYMSGSVVVADRAIPVHCEADDGEQAL